MEYQDTIFFKTALWISLFISFAGIIYRLIRCLTTNKEKNFFKKIASIAKESIFIIFSRKIFLIIWIIIRDILLQIRLFKESKIRWLAHILIFWGFMGLIIEHALGKLIFPNYYSTLNPFMFLRDLFTALVISGLIISILRRIFAKAARRITNLEDIIAISVVSAIILSGLFLEVVKISSYSIFKRMADEYGALEEGSEDFISLEAYWIKNYGLVVRPSPSISKDLLEMGKENHEMSCASCHSNPRWSFLGYGINRLTRPILFEVDKLGGVNILWYLHIILTFLGLAYVPFSKMFHIITTPLNLILRGISEDVSETELIFSLEACTHCGMCTETCVVNICFEEIQNPNVLPSEKIRPIKRFLFKKEITESEKKLLLEGLDICTNCQRCTVICPSGINLQRLWFYMRERLYREGESSILSPFSTYELMMSLEGEYEINSKELFKSLDRKFREYYQKDGIIYVSGIRVSNLISGIAEEKRLFELSEEGRSFSYCFSCKTCTTSCPLILYSEGSPKEFLDLVPHQIMHALSLGMLDPVFKSKMLWKCLGCYKCQENCPQGVKITDIFYELKNMALSFIYKEMMAK